MAYFQSGRPETSVPASSEPAQVPAQPSQVAASDARDESYIPHLFDFVTLAGQAKRINQSSIPPLFLESQAVDTSCLIGDGASFSASRRRLPQVENSEYTTRHGGLTVTTRQRGEARPDYVVYKTARVAFTPSGEPVAWHRRAMSSAMMELYALIHKPLYEHPNVIDYLGLAWGSNPFEPLHKLPIIVVEYAEHGTLSDLQAKEDLPSSVKQTVCLDVALGLDILHHCGIVHGDVKAENVLIFSHPERKYLAKVADFGFSVVEAVANTAINVGGTRPWKAPETKSPVPKDQLKLTDVYSFGLLVWRVATDGQNPFDLLVPADFRREQYSAEIERLKETDELIVRSRLRSWYMSHVKASRRFELTGQSPLPIAELLSKFQIYVTNPALTPAASEGLDLLLSQAMTRLSSLGLPTDLVEKIMLEKAVQDLFYGCFDRILESCLGKSPHSRDLAAAIVVLQTETSPRLNVPDNQNLVLKTSYDHHLISWQQMRDLEPSVQNLIFNAFLSRSQKNATESMVNPPATFALASFYINGYGTEPNYEEAARLLLHAANSGHEHSKAYVYRVCHALSDQFRATESVITDLVNMSLSGSRLALQDLEKVSPDKVLFIRNSLKDLLAGTGANFFYANQMLYGTLRGYWADIFTSKALLAEKLETINNIQDFRLNKRGDRLLHVAASSGKQDAVEILLTADSIDINQCNDQGETALLCACRAGQVDVAHFLLSRGADSSIITETKESPLHWLISFSCDHVETLGAMLVSNGADVRITTNKNISYSVFPSGIDVDHLAPGTPLDWAVHHDRPDIVKFLLESSANPRICLIRASDSRPNAILWAAHFHHTDCLKLMVEAIEKEPNRPYTYGPMLAAATHGADLFSMILRHGSEYRVSLKDSLDYLLVKSKHIHFSTGIGSFGYTLLYYAVTEAHDAVVEYLLSPETQKLLGLQQLNPISLQPESPVRGSTGELIVGDLPGAFTAEHVNLACGSDKRTPLLECVRWNRRPTFQLLVEHGGNACATSRNPFIKDRMDWTALHVFAYAGHNSDLRLVHDLVRAGVPVDGRAVDSTDTETPLTVAIQNNAFKLASTLVHIGADINAPSSSSGLIAGDYPVSILGQIIASTARYSTPCLRYILFECAVHREVRFIVEPERNLTALHRAAWAYRGLNTTSSDSDELKPMRREDYHMNTNRDIMYELLQKFNAPEELNMRCRIMGRTALHLAVDAANVGALKELVDRGADKAMLDDLGETPALLAERQLLSKEDQDWRKVEMEEILHLLKS